MALFEPALSYVLQNEGGFTDHPKDPGGATNFGITQASLAQWRGHPVTREDVLALPIMEAKDIYLKNYWFPICGDGLSQQEVATCLLDVATLYGIRTACMYAQLTARAHGKNISTDGIMGDRSLDAINALPKVIFVRTFHALLLARIDTLTTLNPKLQAFKRGWVTRANKLLALVDIKSVTDQLN